MSRFKIGKTRYRSVKVAPSQSDKITCAVTFWIVVDNVFWKALLGTRTFAEGLVAPSIPPRIYKNKLLFLPERHNVVPRLPDISVQTSIFIALAALEFFATPAHASPPSSCAGKFVGTWVWNGGETDVRRDGTAIPRCSASLCVPVQYWTCEGNLYRFANAPLNGGWTWEAVLLDARRMQGPTGIAVRKGR